GRLSAPSSLADRAHQHLNGPSIPARGERERRRVAEKSEHRGGPWLHRERLGKRQADALPRGKRRESADGHEPGAWITRRVRPGLENANEAIDGFGGTDPSEPFDPPNAI